MNKSAYHRDIAAWYALHGRHELPWRKTSDPYHVYISEVMLQQTQVSTVLQRYYFPFLHAFPTLQALADAPLDAVLKQWEGLGYYSRARNMHKAAKLAAPTLPDTPEALQTLSGIGKNTAHAIACFGFGKAVAIMEANVKRVLHRLTASENMNDATLWELATTLLDADNTFNYNQAMMDIGATICTARQPKCIICPISSHCQGKISPEQYPAKKLKTVIPIRYKQIIIMRNASQAYFMTPRNTTFLGGLYGFIELEQDATHYNNTVIKDMILLGGLEQKYSHFTLNASVHLYDDDVASHGTDWHNEEALTKLPSSKADHKAIALLKAHLSKAEID
jgi:A/G-specific adenine glycosylase